MAALQDPNPYELRPQPRPHAEPGHVHRFVAAGYTQRCIYCHVEETFALRAENDRLQRRVRELEDAMLAIYRTPPRAAGARTGGFAEIHRICANHIALADWRDEQRGDEERTR